LFLNYFELFFIFRRKAKEDGKGVLINCCCPGFVNTELSKGNPNATKSPQEGAQNALALALLPPGVNIQGTYLSDA